MFGNPARFYICLVMEVMKGKKQIRFGKDKQKGNSSSFALRRVARCLSRMMDQVRVIEGLVVAGVPLHNQIVPLEVGIPRRCRRTGSTTRAPERQRRVGKFTASR